MKVTRDVVTDLLPAYLSNEASVDTRALVEEYLQQDPEFASLVKDKRSEDLLKEIPVAPPSRDIEREALIQTRNMLKWRAHWLGLAIVFTLMPLSCVFSSKGLVWLMARDAPYAANTFFIFAVVCWIQYFRTRHKVRSSGV
jgi:hypothetical protein